MSIEEVTAWLPVLRELGGTGVLALVLWLLLTDRMATRGRRADLEKRIEQLTAERDYYRDMVHRNERHHQ